MNKLSSRVRTSALIVTVLACLVVSTVVLVPTVEAQQSQAAEAELARVRAELEARMAQLHARLAEQRAVIDVQQGANTAAAQRLLEELVNEESQMRAALEERYAVTANMQSRLAEEVRERAVEVERRALEQAVQSARRSTIRMRGGCDVFGEQVLDHAEDLELTDDQVSSIREAQRASRREDIGRDADMEIAQMDLEALYEAETPDLTAIRAKLEEVALRGVDGKMAGLSLRQTVRGILTPEQRQGFDDMGRGDNVRIRVSGMDSGWSTVHIGC